MKTEPEAYRIKIKMEVWWFDLMIYQKTSIVPGRWSYSEVQSEIVSEIERRLKHQDFFRCQDKEFDLVKYAHEGSYKTYLRLDPWPMVNVLV